MAMEIDGIGDTQERCPVCDALIRWESRVGKSSSGEVVKQRVVFRCSTGEPHLPQGWELEDVDLSIPQDFN